MGLHRPTYHCADGFFFFMNQPTCVLQNDFSWSEIEFKHNLINQDMITAVELNVHGPSFLFCEPVISRLLSKDKNAQYSWVAQSHRTPVSSTTGTQTLISWNDANPSIVLLLLCIVRLFFFTFLHLKNDGEYLFKSGPVTAFVAVLWKALEHCGPIETKKPKNRRHTTSN